jgi:hypothetical protein
MIAARSNAASGGGTCSSRKRHHVRYGSVMEAVCASAVNLATRCCHTLLPNSNLRWEAIDDDVLVAVGEHVTRAVRIMAMIDPRDPSSHRCSSRGRRRHAPARGRCGRPGRCDRRRARELLATCPSANSPLDLGIFVECPLRARTGHSLKCRDFPRRPTFLRSGHKRAAHSCVDLARVISVAD